MSSIHYWNWLAWFAFLMQQNYMSGSAFKIGSLEIQSNSCLHVSTARGKKIHYISRVRGCFSAKHTNCFFMRKLRGASLIERSPVTLLSAGKWHKKWQFIDPKFIYPKTCRPIQTCPGYGSTLEDDGLQCCVLTHANMSAAQAVWAQTLGNH